MTDLAAVRPTTRYYLGLLANPYDALSTVAWTEIPNTQVKVRTLRWGAQHELARVEPSYASLLLDNTAGDFETLNPASPYYPYLRPLNRLRIVDTWAGVDYIRFTGYVTDWPRSWTGINQAVVNVEAYDALGAVLNAVDIYDHAWEMTVRNLVEQVPATGKATWLRLNETSGTTAADSSGYGLDGQYQGSPTLGVDGLVTADADKAFAPIPGSRVSLPYKNLISGYPFTVSLIFRATADRTRVRALFTAYDGPSYDGRQYMQMFVEYTGGGANAGKIVALVVNPYPTGTQVLSTGTVDDGLAHHLVWVATSSTSFKLYLDGVDVTAPWASASHSYPNDLLTGYAVGNTPAVAFGDYNLANAATTDAVDELLVLDGLALSASQVQDAAAAFLADSELIIPRKTGQKLTRLLNILGWPFADRDIDTGLTTTQPAFAAGKAQAYMQRLEVTEGGRLYVSGDGKVTFRDRHAILRPPYTVSQATFGEGAGEIGYVGPFNHGEDDADIFNDVRVANVGGIVQVARSKASKDRYGWKTLGLTDLLGTSDSEARDRANRDLAIYAEPVTRIRSITVKPQEDAAQGTAVWPALLSLIQNSRVTVKAQPPGASLITQASHVEHYEETVTPKDWQITLGLSAAQAVEFWTLGTSALGSGTKLSY